MRNGWEMVPALITFSFVMCLYLYHISMNLYEDCTRHLLLVSNLVLHCICCMVTQEISSCFTSFHVSGFEFPDLLGVNRCQFHGRIKLCMATYTCQKSSISICIVLSVICVLCVFSCDRVIWVSDRNAIVQDIAKLVICDFVSSL